MAFNPEVLDVPWTQSPFFHRILQTKNLTRKQRSAAEAFHKNGFLVVKGLIGEDLQSRIKEQIHHLFDNSVPDGPRSYYRVQDAWHEASGLWM